MRTAVIDIGSNTLLLLIVEPDASGALLSIIDLCRFGRLGKGLDASGKLQPESIAKSLDICREYRGVMDEHGVTKPTIIGTQALREASNAAELIAPAERILGAPIEVIEGKREAALAFTAVARTFPELAGTPYVVVDVGGASTELITTDGTRVVSAVSVPIGVVRLTERHVHHDPPLADELHALEVDIDRHLAELVLPTGVPVVGTAGTATTMGAIKLELVHYDSAAVTGLRLSPEVVATQLARLSIASADDRRAIRGLQPERADVILAGIVMYARVLRRIGAPVIITCDRGIRWGIAYEAARPLP